jgi:glycosyltransferase involved in cell wall biosynthesis
MYMPTVSVVIPALNEEQHIAHSIRSVVNCDYAKEKIEIVVVDNGSQDRTVEIANNLNAKVIVDLCKNVGGLRNLGCTAAKGEIFGFLDADCTVREDWLRNSTKILQDNRIGLTGHCCFPPVIGNWVEKAWGFHILNNHGGTGDVKYINSGNCFIRRDVFYAVGGFSESLESSEDTDICERIGACGYKIWQSDMIVAVHWGYPKTLRSFVEREIWHGIGATKNSIKEFWRSKPLLLSFYNIILCFLIPFIAYFLPLLIGLLIVLPLFLLPCVLSAVHLCMKTKKLKFFLPLVVLYSAYGIGRTISVILCFSYTFTRKISTH